MEKGKEMQNINKTIALEDCSSDELSTQTAQACEVYMAILVWWNTVKWQRSQRKWFNPKIWHEINPLDMSYKYKKFKFFIDLHISNAGIQSNPVSFPIFRETCLSWLSAPLTTFISLSKVVGFLPEKSYIWDFVTDTEKMSVF